jgi:Xaa-Pro aminopeptidase
MVRPFTSGDFANRMERAATQAREAGLTGVLVTPGPDLMYFTGYQPIAITERITMLALQDARDPAMIVPVLERPEAEAAPGAATLSLTDWTDGTDPYLAASSLLDPHGTYAISDSAWAMRRTRCCSWRRCSRPRARR